MFLFDFSFQTNEVSSDFLLRVLVQYIIPTTSNSLVLRTEQNAIIQETFILKKKTLNVFVEKVYLIT